MEIGSIVRWNGVSGKIYSFRVYSLRSSFNEVECVYIYTKIVIDKWVPIYVGETSHLHTRIREHATHKEKCDLLIQKSGATHIHIYRLAGDGNRKEKEKDLIDNPYYFWTCNDPETQLWKKNV